MIDPSIALSYRPVQIENPLDVQTRLANLAAMRQQQQAAAQQYQLGTLQLQNAQLQQSQDADFRSQYAEALRTGTTLTPAQIYSTLGTRGAGIVEAMQKAQETAAQTKKLQADALKAQGEIQLQHVNYAGNVADALLEHKDPKTGLIDPTALGIAAKQAAQDGYADEAQQLINLAGQDPSKVAPVLEQLAGNSPEVQTRRAARAQADARNRQAAVAENTQRAQTMAFALGNAGSQAAYGDALAKYKADPATAELASRFPAVYNPTAILRAGSTTAEALNSAETARRDQQEELQRQAIRGFDTRRLNIEQQNADTNASRLTFEKNGGAAGNAIDDPAYIKGVVNGEIKINPRDKHFAEISAAAKNIDPTWTSDRFDNRQHFTQSVTSGPLSRNVTAINQGLAHLAEFKAASDKVGAAGMIAGAFGAGHVSGDIKALQDAQDTTGHELTTMFAQGQGTQAETTQTQQNLAGVTQSARNAGIKQYANLIGGRIRALAKQHVAATGEAFPVDRYIDSAAVDFLKSQGVDVYKIASDEAATWMKSKQGAAAAAPTAAPAAKAPSLSNVSTNDLFRMLQTGTKK